MTYLDVDAVGDHLRGRGVAVAGKLTATLITGGRSNLTYHLSDGVSEWVLRRPPTGGLTPSAHDMGREFRVLQGLQDTAVPVPETVAFCDDPGVIGAPFGVVAHVAGTVFRSAEDLDELTDAEIAIRCRAMIQVLAALHAVDHGPAGLTSLGRPEGFLSRQVRLWAGQWQRVAQDPSPDIDALGGWLADHVPARSESAVVHGDFRIDNVLFGGTGGVAAVLDWELATLGDPLTDVALMGAYRNPAMDLIMGFPAAWTSARLPDADTLTEAYTAVSGRDPAHWEFYRALAHFKLAVIAAGIDHRYRQDVTTGPGFDRAAEAVGEFAAAGVRIISAARVS